MILRERPISQGSYTPVGVAVMVGTEFGDPDNNEVFVTVTRDSDSAELVTRNPATRDDEGLYSYSLHTPLTDQMGDYTVLWEWEVSGQPVTLTDQYQVVEPMPYFDSLDSVQKTLVMNIYHKVSNTFDSIEGGPYLWEVLQSNFNAYETIARLTVTDAMYYINFTFQPIFNPPWNFGGSGKQVPTQFYGIVDKAGYVEFLRHLSRSYIEQPDERGVNTAYLDRKAYRQQWKQEADEEKKTLDSQLKQMKRKYLLGTRRSWVISGGPITAYMPIPGRPTWLYRH